MLQNNTYILLISMYSNIYFFLKYSIPFYFIEMLVLKPVDLFLDTPMEHNPQFNKHCPRELNQRHRCPTSAGRRGNPAAGEQRMS